MLKDYALAREHKNTRNKQYQANNVAKGLCPCGQFKPASPKHIKCVKCIEARKAWYEANKAKVLRKMKAQALALRVETLEHYGQECVCCGEDYPHFLVLDHIKGGGTRH